MNTWNQILDNIVFKTFDTMSIVQLMKIVCMIYEIILFIDVAQLKNDKWNVFKEGGGKPNAAWESNLSRNHLKSGICLVKNCSFSSHHIFTGELLNFEIISTPLTSFPL